MLKAEIWASYKGAVRTVQTLLFSVRLTLIIFVNLFYYLIYFCYYSWVSLYFLYYL